MKIEEVRTSFTVYLIASRLERLDGIAESLGLAGYMAASFSELTAAFSEFPSNPPHFLMFDATETSFDLTKAIHQVSAQLPESHVFVLTPFEKREQYVHLLEDGVYDLIYAPLVSQIELLRALDRAAERDYFMYMNERLAETAAPAPAPDEATVVTNLHAVESPAVANEGFHAYALNLFASRSPDQCLEVFLSSASQTLGRCGVVYFKYVANRRVLLASQSLHLEEFEVKGLGVNFNEAGSPFKSAHLRDPMGIPEFSEMLHEVFNTEDFLAFPVEALGEIQGVAAFLCAQPDGITTQRLQDELVLANRALSALESERRLHVSAVKDPVTDLLNRANFLGKIEHEISRARRTSSPVSMLLIAVDAHARIVSELGQEEGGTILRVIARILEKHSRINDVLGRTGNDEFAILLPHTGRQGAMIKAERLRRLLQSADFSKVLSAFPHLTVSVGVSEYPTLVRDAEELLQTCEEALFSVRGAGNKACVARTPQNFTPDFHVQEKEAP